MFNDQFQQFSLSPFPLHENSSSFPTGFDLYQQFHHQIEKQHTIVDETVKAAMEPDWSSDEVLLLIRIRSSMDNCFSWEHVSRKLEELGFKRSAEQCKEKFEEEESGDVMYNKNYSKFAELDDIYPSENREQTQVIKDREVEKQNEKDKEKMNLEGNSKNVAITCDDMSEEVVKKPVKSNKRKRTGKIEKLKGFCVEIVNKMMAQQEELQNRLIDDIVKRDEDLIARDEARKNEKMVRTRMEIEKWAQEQAIASERQSIIIEFLKTFAFEKGQESNSSILSNALMESTLQSGKTPPVCNSLPGSKLEPVRKLQEQADKTSSTLGTKDSSSTSLSLPSPDNDAKKVDTGMRWPRDQVLALINIRCKYSNATISNNDEAANKGPLWERISQGMMELGYKRSAKRCKEKWENINKYYRKTKDSNKKRSVDSRTCPYFHELSRLHGEGTTTVAPTNE